MKKNVSTLEALSEKLGVSMTRARNLVTHGCIQPCNEIVAGNKHVREFSSDEVSFVKEFASMGLFEAIASAVEYKRLYEKEKKKNDYEDEKKKTKVQSR